MVVVEQLISGTKPDISKDSNKPALNLPDDLQARFEVLITNTILAYDEYSKQQMFNATKISTPRGGQDEAHKEHNTESIGLIDESLSLFEKFQNVFNKLLKTISSAKQNTPLQFVNTFRKTNANTIKLYEFASKLLHSTINDSCEALLENKKTVMKRVIELLHILITNQNEENDDDESSILCCDHLAQCFNFTTPLCSVLLNHLIRQGDQASLLTEKSYRMAFTVLIKLTVDNRLFSIDSYVKQFIQLSIKKMFESNLQNYFFQFVANAIRNNKREIEAMLHETGCFYSFCRKIMQIIHENNNSNVTLNSLTIVVILCFDNPVLGLAKSNAANQNTIKYIDLAINILSQNNEDDKADVLRSDFSGCFLKSKALNFLMELFKHEQVITTLEYNEDYSNLILFKLNQLFIENGSKSTRSSGRFSNISIKIFKILDGFVRNSEKLAQKLFQIVFNTRRFIEQKSKNSDYDLSRKLKELILSNSATAKLTSKKPAAFDEQDDILINYYIKSLKLTVIDHENSSSKRTHCLANSLFYLNYFKYLYALLKANKKINEEKEIETKTNKFLVILIENFNQLHSFYNEFSRAYHGNEEIVDQIYFFTVSTIDVILSETNKPTLMSSKMIQKLFEMIKINNLIATESSNAYTITWSMLADNFIVKEENILVICKLLLRLVVNDDARLESDLKDRILNFFKSEHFLSLISYGITEIDRPDLTELAYGLFIDLNKLSDSIAINKYSFPFEMFLKVNTKLRKEHQPPVEFKKQSQELNQTELKSIVLADNENLFEFYEQKLAEKKNQEMQMFSILNQYFSNSLSLEAEMKLLRDSIRLYSQREIEMKKEISSFEIKHADLIRSIQDLKQNNAELNKLRLQLEVDNKKFVEQYECLKLSSEQSEKDYDETINNLQKTLSNESNLKRELQTKLKDTHQKFIEIDKLKQVVEAKNKELDAKLEAKVKEFDELKSENDKIKSILSYVKDNYK